MIGCSSAVQKPAGPAGAYEKAKAAFAQGTSEGYAKALDVLENLANANPSNDYTDRARVLRLVIFSGEVEGYKTLSDAYAKGTDTAKAPAIKSEYAALRRETVQRGAEPALRLGEVAMQLTKGGNVPKDLSLDAPYPSLEPPTTVPALDRVRTGLKIGPDDQAQAESACVRMGVADALAALLHGDRSKAKAAMNAGPVPIDSAEFGFFMANQIMAGATFYDPKHLDDPSHFRALVGVAGDALQPIQAAIKQSPDREQARRLKKLQAQINAALKAFGS
jgi:hypothetical protein